MRLALWIAAALAAAAALVPLSRDLAPPRTLVLAAGPEGGGYHALARRYAEALARDGIAVEVLATRGSVDNARLISEGRAGAAILQGGVVPHAPVRSLGAVFPEPLFAFAAGGAEGPDGPPANPALWGGIAIAAGAEGSGTRAAALDLMEAASVAAPERRLVPLGGAEAARALLAGEVDLALFVAPLAAPYLEPLLGTDRARALRLEHLRALTGRLPASTRVTLPSGAVSLAPPLPRDELEMLAMVAELAARPDLHPSLVDRLVTAAVAIHGGRGALTRDGEYPTMRLAALPPSPYARDLLEDGPSPLHRHLPYWVVAQVARFAILLLPVLFVLLPLIRALPGLYIWRMRRRVFRHYAAIRAIDEEARATDDPARLAALAERLEGLDREIAALSLPLPYRELAYTARLHIDLLRKRLTERGAAARRAA